MMKMQNFECMCINTSERITKCFVNKHKTIQRVQDNQQFCMNTFSNEQIQQIACRTHLNRTDLIDTAQTQTHIFDLYVRKQNNNAQVLVCS